MSLLKALLPALLLTAAAEGAAIFLMRRSLRWVLLSIAGNVATNPLLNLLLIPVRSAEDGTILYAAVLLLLELLAVLYEALLYRIGTEASQKICLRCSGAANLTSFLLGLLLF